MLLKIKKMVNPALEFFKGWVKTNQADIILLIGVILISLLSFAFGYIAAKTADKEPLRIENLIEK